MPHPYNTYLGRHPVRRSPCKDLELTRQCLALQARMLGLKAAPSHLETLVVGLGIGDLIDRQSHPALGDDVGDAIADLDGNDRVCCIDAHHGEKVHDWVCAPTDYGQSSVRLCKCACVNNDTNYQ